MLTHVFGARMSAGQPELAAQGSDPYPIHVLNRFCTRKVFYILEVFPIFRAKKCAEKQIVFSFRGRPHIT